MSSDLTFITNEAGKSLRDRFSVLLSDDTRFFDCLVGYFFISGFYKLHLALEKVEKVTEAMLDEIIELWNLKKQESKGRKQSSYSENGELALQDLIERCDFIKFCSECPEKVKEPLWYAMISNIVCIRPGGYSVAHKLSKGYPGYDRSETDNEIHHALDAAAPHTCKYIQNNGFECSKKCGIRAPAALLSRKVNTVGK